MAPTHVFAANLKNSVTRFVDPFRVIAWRVGACFVDAMIVIVWMRRERVLVCKWQSSGRTRTTTRRAAEPLNSIAYVT